MQPDHWIVLSVAKSGHLVFMFPDSYECSCILRSSAGWCSYIAVTTEVSKLLCCVCPISLITLCLLLALDSVAFPIRFQS